MLCEAVLGSLKENKYQNRTVDYVDFEWHETFKKLHRKVTYAGDEIGIRFNDEILKQGLRQGDVLFCDDKKVVAVNLLPCEVIVADVEEHHSTVSARVCYEVGNRHAPLFWGETHNQFITPYSEPMFVLLEKIHGVSVIKKTMVLDLDRRISGAVHNHVH